MFSFEFSPVYKGGLFSLAELELQFSFFSKRSDFGLYCET